MGRKPSSFDEREPGRAGPRAAVRVLAHQGTGRGRESWERPPQEAAPHCSGQAACQLPVWGPAVGRCSGEREEQL